MCQYSYLNDGNILLSFSLSSLETSVEATCSYYEHLLDF